LPLSENESLQEKVYVIQANGRSGTGFVLDGGSILTCDHVAGDADDVEYFTYNNFCLATRKHANLRADWRSSENSYDVALIPIARTQETHENTFKLAPVGYEVKTGDKYKIVGFPQYTAGSPPHIMSVEVTNVKEVDGVVNAYVAQKMVGGYSGSPVVNENGYIVGIVQRGTESYRTGDDLAGYTFLPIQELRKCIKSFLNSSV
jgi:V8-like Glu-specific endopeptidase